MTVRVSSARAFWCSLELRIRTFLGIARLTQHQEARTQVRLGIGRQYHLELLFGGRPGKLVDAARAGRSEAVVSLHILRELADVAPSAQPSGMTRATPRPSRRSSPRSPSCASRRYLSSRARSIARASTRSRVATRVAPVEPLAASKASTMSRRGSSAMVRSARVTSGGSHESKADESRRARSAAAISR